MAFVPKRMPETETNLPPERVSEMFDVARNMTRNQPPEERRIAVVTPGRNIIPFMCPRPGSMPPEHVEPIENLFPSKKPLDIAVIAYTEMSHFIDKHGQNPGGANEAIPFFGYLLGMGYAGHSVVIFEGHPSALEIGCDLADALVVDDAMIRFLSKDWGEQALRRMRSEKIIIFGRNGQLSAYQTPLPPVQQLSGAMSQEAEKAMAAMDKGDVRNSLAFLDKAIQRWPGIGFLYYLRGRYSQ
ncbi:MAG: hypothetical protein K8I30_17125, partial [Anaerolineae bacterium]|nr:hypothetical protein [Anaerolineae bacterium]